MLCQRQRKALIPCNEVLDFLSAAQGVRFAAGEVSVEVFDDFKMRYFCSMPPALSSMARVSCISFNFRMRSIRCRPLERRRVPLTSRWWNLAFLTAPS